MQSDSNHTDLRFLIEGKGRCSADGATHKHSAKQLDKVLPESIQGYPRPKTSSRRPWQQRMNSRVKAGARQVSDLCQGPKLKLGWRWTSSSAGKTLDQTVAATSIYFKSVYVCFVQKLWCHRLQGYLFVMSGNKNVSFCWLYLLLSTTASINRHLDYLWWIMNLYYPEWMDLTSESDVQSILHF